MSDHLPERETTSSEIILYQTEDGQSRIQVRLEDGTVWLSQKLMAELFQKDVRTINEHIGNIFAEGELSPEATLRKYRIVRTEGSREVSREIEFYNLDVEFERLAKRIDGKEATENTRSTEDKK